MSNADRERSTTRKAEKTFQKMLNAVGDSLSDLASSDDEKDGEHKEEENDTELGKLSEDDEPGWVMGTISKTVPHCMESFQQTQLGLEKLTQPGCGDMADYFRERDTKYGMTKLMVPAIVRPLTDSAAATPLPKTFGELMQTLDIVPGQLQMPQETSRPGSSQMRLGSVKLQSHPDIASLLSHKVAILSQSENRKAVEPVSLDCHISRP
jgi:hypothetical protein